MLTASSAGKAGEPNVSVEPELRALSFWRKTYKYYLKKLNMKLEKHILEPRVAGRAEFCHLQICLFWNINYFKLFICKK